MKTRLETERVNVPVEGLAPALEGLRFAVLSDLHIADAPLDVHWAALERTEALRPDAVLLCGDMIDDRTRGVENIGPYLARLARLAPTIAVLGNNDCLDIGRLEALRALYREQGVTLLENEKRVLRLRGEEISVTGLEDPEVEARGLRRTLTRAQEKAPRLTMREAIAPPEAKAPPLSLVMLHRPELARPFAALRPSLMVAGHAHGGQVRLPLLGGLYAPGQGIFPRLTSGLYQIQGTRMLVSRGLGNHGCPVRLGNPFHLPIAVLGKNNSQFA